MKKGKLGDETKAMIEKARQKKQNGDFNESIEMLNAILAKSPGCLEAYEELGDNYLNLRDLEKARKALNEAIKINDLSSNAHYLLGFLFSIEENWKESVEELKKANAIDPHHPEILRCLGWSIYNSNRRSLGISLLERSRNLNPQDFGILCDLGLCYMNSLEYQKAEKTFKQALKQNPNLAQAQKCLNILKRIQKEDSEEENTK